MKIKFELEIEFSEHLNEQALDKVENNILSAIGYYTDTHGLVPEDINGYTKKMAINYRNEIKLA